VSADGVSGKTDDMDGSGGRSGGGAADGLDHGTDGRDGDDIEVRDPVSAPDEQP